MMRALAIFFVIAGIAFALAILRATVLTHPSEANTEMPLVYCHSQGGVVKDGKCVKKGSV